MGIGFFKGFSGNLGYGYKQIVLSTEVEKKFSDLTGCEFTGIVRVSLITIKVVRRAKTTAKLVK